MIHWRSDHFESFYYCYSVRSDLDKVEERRMSGSERPSGTFGSFTTDGEEGGFSMDSTPPPSPHSPGDGSRKPTIKMVEHTQEEPNRPETRSTEDVPAQKQDTKRKKALSRMGLFPLVLIAGYFFGMMSAS